MIIFRPILITIFGFLLLLIESSLISFPFTFIYTSCILIIFRSRTFYLIAFILGLFADSFRVVDLSITPIFAFATYLVVLLYEKYFGRNDYIAEIAIVILISLIYSYLLSFSFFNLFIMILSLLSIWMVAVFVNFTRK